MTERSVTHATFTLQRTYKASPERVFGAFSDFEKKRQWFGSDDGDNSTASMDFRVGGREHSSGIADVHGRVHQYRFDCVYLDIVENERIAYAYDMDADGQHISASLTTIEFAPSSDGTHLKLTEQGAFLDGYDNPKDRETGTRGLLEALAKAVED